MAYIRPNPSPYARAYLMCGRNTIVTFMIASIRKLEDVYFGIDVRHRERERERNGDGLFLGRDALL